MKKRLLPIAFILLLLLALTLAGCKNEDVPLERIAVTSLPKLNYLKGETFQLNNAKVTLYYADGREDTIPMTREMVSDYDPQEVGSHTLTVRYDNKFVNIRITIANSPVVNVEAVQGVLPYKTDYIEEQSLDVENLRLKINYETGNPDIIPVTADMVSGYNASTIGHQILYIKYTEPASGKEFYANYTVYVARRQVSNISISSPPVKKLYLLNEKITFESLEGGVLFIAYDNGFNERIPFGELFATQTELDNALSYSTAEEKNREIVTLNYRGKQVIFDIRVLIKDAVSFEMLSSPADYRPQIVGTPISLAGGMLRVEYNNESVEVFPMTDPKVIGVLGYDSSTAGVQTITLRFSDIASTFQFDIEVIDTKITALEILPPVLDDGVIKKYSETDARTPVIFYQGGTIDLSYWQYRLLRDNGTYSNIYNLESSMLSGGAEQLLLNEAGLKTLNFIFHAGETPFTASVDVPVVAKLLERITLTPPAITIYYLNSPLNLTGGTFTAYFNDGTRLENQSLSGGDVEITGYRSTVLGYQDITVTFRSAYGSRFATFTVLVVRQPSRIVFDTDSAVKRNYVLGEDFDISNLTMKLYFEGIAAAEIFAGPFTEEWRFENTRFDSLGNLNVIVYYCASGIELSAAIPVTVRNDIVSINLVRLQGSDYVSAVSLPDIIAGMELNLTGYFVKCTLENGVSYIPATQSMFNYVRSDRTAGIRSLTLTYSGKTVTGISITVHAREISAFELISRPDKKYYKSSVAVDYVLNGLSFKVSYTNNTFILINASELVKISAAGGFVTYRYNYVEDDGSASAIDFRFTELDVTLQPGETSAQRTVEISLDTRKISFTVIVADQVATGITWNISPEGQNETLQPEITAYQSLGKDRFSFAPGAQFKVFYNEGESSGLITLKDVWNEITLVGFNNNISGAQTIHLLYGDVLLKTVVKVQPKILVSVQKALTFSIPSVTEGMDLNLVSAVLTVTFRHNIPGWTDSDNFVENVPVSKEMVTNYSKSITPRSDFEVIIEYTFNGRTEIIRHNIAILVKQLVGIDVYKMPQTRYIERSDFSADAGSIILYYNNNTNEIKSMQQPESRWVDSFSDDYHYQINKGAFDSADFSGYAKRFEILIKYFDGVVMCYTSYDITIHDRLYITVEFDESDAFRDNDKTYYYIYGEDQVIGYSLWGYKAFTDIESELEAKELTNLIAGTHYIFKYVNTVTGVEHYSWPKDVGTYKIWVQYNANSLLNNDRVHNSLEFSGRNLTIQPRTVRVFAEAASKVYGESLKPFTFTVKGVQFIPGAGGTVLENLSDDNIFGYNEGISALGNLKFSCLDNGGSAVNSRTNQGSYSITVYIDGTLNPNYTVTFVSATLRITPREVIVIANPSSKIYGVSDPVFTYTTSGVIGNSESGLMPGDTFIGLLGRDSASANRNVGVYAINIGTLQNSNYKITLKSASFEIKQCEIDIKVTDAFKTYGVSAPAFGVTAYQTGTGTALPNGENISTPGLFTGTLTYTVKDGGGGIINANTAGAGPYTVTVSGLTSQNYKINYINGTFTVYRRIVEIVPGAGQSITYGDSFGGVYTYTVRAKAGVVNSGLVAGDSITGLLSKDDPLNFNADIYNITAGTITNANNPNYEIEFVSGAKFTVNKRIAQIQIKSSSLSRSYNGLVPSLSADDYNLINASGDIKANISFDFPNKLPKVGIYTVVFSSNDPNHTLSFEKSDGYIFTITAKTVTPVFVNIPYGPIVDGAYSGVTYSGMPYYMGAQIPVAQIETGDTVDVVIHIANYVAGMPAVYQPKNSVLDAGSYLVKIESLSNSNYVIAEPSPADIAAGRDYRYTAFKVNPLKVQILMFRAANGLISKQYTGNEIRFNNSIILQNGYYQSLDYRIVTPINEEPRSLGIDVYPYFMEGDRIRIPRAVKLSGDTILGYDIALTIANKNYKAELVNDIGGGTYVPVPLNPDGTIMNESDKFKILRKEVTVIIDNRAATKIYDGSAPEFAENTVHLSDMSVTASFTFDRIYTNPAEFSEYDVPSAMLQYIKDKDAGRFNITPYCADPNYSLTIAQNSPTVYTIQRKRVTRFDLLVTSKEYDGLIPSVNVSQFTITGYTLDERDNLRWVFDFTGGNSQAFNVGTYTLNVKFRFPYENPVDWNKMRITGGAANGVDIADCDMLDYNHYFAAVANCSLNKTFTITQRKVMLKMLNTEAVEGYNWKYYNGLSDAYIYDFSSADSPVTAPSDKNKFNRAFIIVDARAYGETPLPELESTNNIHLPAFINGDVVRLKHMLNGDGVTTLTDSILGYLRLSQPSSVNAGVFGVTAADVINNAANSNFDIKIDTSVNLSFEIKRRSLAYYIDTTEVCYGESIGGIENYNYRLAPAFVKYLSLDDYNQYILTSKNLFNLSPSATFMITGNMFPVALSGGISVTDRTNAGLYDITCTAKVSYFNYELNYDAAASKEKFVINRRELPISPMYSVASNAVLQRVYGSSNLNAVSFKYMTREVALLNGKAVAGLLPGDSLLTADGFIPPAFTLANLAARYDNDFGIIYDPNAIILAYDAGLNTNYYFTYEDFAALGVILEITKADLNISIINTITRQKYLEAVYGEAPAANEYDFAYSGLSTVTGDTLDNLFLPRGVNLPQETIGGITFSAGAFTDLVKFNIKNLTSVNFVRNVAWNAARNTVIPHTDLKAIFFDDPLQPYANVGWVKRYGVNGQGVEGYYDYYYNQTVQIDDTKLRNYNIVRENTEYKVLQRNIEMSLESLYQNSEGNPYDMYNILQDETPLLWDNVREEWLIYYYYALQNGISLDTDTHLNVSKIVIEELLRRDSSLSKGSLLIEKYTQRQILNYAYCKNAQWLIAYMNENKAGVVLLSKYTPVQLVGYINAYNAAYPGAKIGTPGAYDFDTYTKLSGSDKIALLNYISPAIDVDAEFRALTDANLQNAINLYYNEIYWLLRLGETYETIYLRYKVFYDGVFDLEAAIGELNALPDAIQVTGTGKAAYDSISNADKLKQFYYTYPGMREIDVAAYMSSPEIIFYMSQNGIDLRRCFNSDSEYNSALPETLYMLLDNWDAGNNGMDSYYGILVKVALYNESFRIRTAITPGGGNKIIFNELSNDDKRKLYDYIVGQPINVVFPALASNTAVLGQILHDVSDSDKGMLFSSNYGGFPDIADVFINTLFTLFAYTDSDIEYAFDNLPLEVISSRLRELLSGSKRSFFADIIGLYSGSGLETVYGIIKEDMMPYSFRRRLYSYVYQDSQLVYGDTLGGAGSAVNVSNIGLNYDTHAGINKQLLPAVRELGNIIYGNGTNYYFVYVPTQINIYRYIVDIGFNLNLPNIVLSTADYENFSVKVTYNDGYSEYIKFSSVLNMLETDPESFIQYFRDFTMYDAYTVIDDDFKINQEIRIKLYEKFFKLQDSDDFEINNEFVSKVFKVRMYEESDTKLWEQLGSIIDLDSIEWGNSAEYSIFYREAAGIGYEKVLGNKIDTNNTYLAANMEKRYEVGIGRIAVPTPVTEQFDILEATVRAVPKAINSYSFSLIVNGSVVPGTFTLDKSIAVRFKGGASNYIEIVINDAVIQTIPKPAALDLFDGYSHSIKVYIDRLGSSRVDNAPYDGGNRLIIVIDNSFYYSQDLGSNYIIGDSVAGFRAVDCNLWVGKFDLYKQGLSSVRAVVGVPYTVINESNTVGYFSHNYNLNGAASMSLSAATARQFALAYVMERSSYLSKDGLPGSLKASDFRYEMFLDGIPFTATVTLTAGSYLLRTDIYNGTDLLSSFEAYINVSKQYAFHDLKDSSSADVYMSMGAPASVYGYTYTGNNDKVMNSEAAANLQISSGGTAVNTDFTHIRSTFRIEIPTNFNPSSADNDGNELEYDTWRYPYNFAYIIKTTDPSRDIRDHNNYQNNTYSGIGIYIRKMQSGYAAKLYVRSRGAELAYENLPNIDWGREERITVDAYFDRNAKRIDLIIIQGNTLVYSSSITTGIDSLLNAASSSAKFIVQSAKAYIYGVETGIKMQEGYNYYNVEKDLFVMNQGKTVLPVSQKLYFSNNAFSELGVYELIKNYSFGTKAMRNNVNTFEYTFTADVPAFISDTDLFSFNLSADGNFPGAASSFTRISGNNHHRGVNIAYRELSANNYAFRVSLYKAGYVYRPQIIATDKKLYADGEHTVKFVIERNTVNTAKITGKGANDEYDGTIVNYLGMPVTIPKSHADYKLSHLNPTPDALGVYKADTNFVFSGGAGLITTERLVIEKLHIYVDGELIGTAIIPYENNTKALITEEGNLYTDLYTPEQGYDALFMPSYIYAGIDTKLSVIILSKVRMI